MPAPAAPTRPELVPVLCDQIGAIADDVREAEIASAKKQLEASMLMGLESTTNRCEQHATHHLIFGKPLAPAEVVAKDPGGGPAGGGAGRPRPPRRPADRRGAGAGRPA